MSEIQRAALFGKLNSVGYKSLEAATVFCKLRGNPYVELVHWLHQVLQMQNSDVHRIVRGFQLDPSRLARDLTAALDRLPRGATAISDFSAHVEEAVERGWVYGSLMFGEGQVRTGHVMVGIAKTAGLKNVLLSISREFEKVKGDRLADELPAMARESPEATLGPTDGSRLGAMEAAPGEASGAMAPAQLGKQEALRRFAVDLTERARKGEIDPVVGRDDDIRQLIDILMRRRQNNPILTGEAGVGKTAVVEGFALRIAKGEVPPALKDVSLRALDIGLLQAGASMKGEFENRLRQVIDEVQASPKPIVLFIDEAHTLIGAGGAAGTGDAANLLKPALARGALRTIAATTWAEYKKHIEKDPALTRRFQVIQVAEPSEEQAVRMLRAIASTLEKHHRIQVLDEALEAAVRLSHRYIPARQLPDKAVGLIDTACARVAVSQHATPAEVEDCQRLRLRQPADGAGGHLLLLPARGRKAHGGAGGFGGGAQEGARVRGDSVLPAAGRRAARARPCRALGGVPRDRVLGFLLPRPRLHEAPRAAGREAGGGRGRLGGVGEVRLSWRIRGSERGRAVRAHAAGGGRGPPGARGGRGQCAGHHAGDAVQADRAPAERPESGVLGGESILRADAGRAGDVGFALQRGGVSVLLHRPGEQRAVPARVQDEAAGSAGAADRAGGGEGGGGDLDRFVWPREGGVPLGSGKFRR
jgi:hypothetical protein